MIHKIAFGYIPCSSQRVFFIYTKFLMPGYTKPTSWLYSKFFPFPRSN